MSKRQRYGKYPVLPMVVPSQQTKKRKLFEVDRRKKIKKELVRHSTQRYGIQRYGDEIHTHFYVWEVAMGNAEYILNAALIPQGDDIINRTGRKTMIRHVKLRGYVQNDVVTATNPFAVRVMLLYDRQPCGATAATTDFNNPSTGVKINGVIPNLTSGNRFRVLYDVTKTFGQTFEGTNETTMTGPRMQTWEADIPCYLPQTYNSTGNAITDLTQGNLILYVVQNFASNADAYFTVCSLFKP